MLRINKVNMNKYILIMTLLSSANSNALSGNELFLLMQDDNKKDSVRYIQGLVDMQSFMYLSDKQMSNKNNITFNEKFYFCVPKNVMYGQIYEIFKKYLTNNPETRHEQASNLLFGALIPVWPCPVE